MKRYTLSRKAEEDIIDIFLYGAAEFGIQQAERYHNLMEKTFRFLAENPEAARECVEIMPPVRIHPFESHVVIYKVDANDDILIIRVRHGREDWRRDE